MRFTRMHGIGNDYVYLDGFRDPLPDDPAKVATQVADRHFGVGGDGLIMICPSTVADARMRMFNADGSESEMCGNGIRCVAKYVYDHQIAVKPRLKIETGAGVLTVDVEAAGGRVSRVRVDMGQPILAGEKIPTTFKGERVVDVPLPPLDVENAASLIERCGIISGMTCVSMGNPHVTIYVRDVQAMPLEAIGPLLERHPVFPRRINVHFVQVHSPREVTMRTWERGSGITLACGTGASAVCVSGVLTGRSDRRILAHLPGGDLELEWAENDHVYMTGAATEVFTGEWQPN
jgi:diaminopimelate epimerase